MLSYTPVPESGCWLFDGRWNSKGYGVLFAGGIQQYAHRLSFEEHVGEIPPGEMVRHRCDTRACINPAHLLCGTAAQNSGDMVSRGRQASGERNGRARLTEQQVQAIREDTGTYSEMAERHGVSRSHVWYIRNGVKRRENA